MIFYLPWYWVVGDDEPLKFFCCRFFTWFVVAQ